MKKYLGPIALWTAAIVALSSFSYAVQTCQRSDFFCFESGSSQNLTTPARLDSSGNLTLTGNESTSNSTVTGTSIFTPQVITGISSTTIITPTSTFVQLLSTGNPVTVGLPTNAATGQTFYMGISTIGAVAGQFVMFYSTSTTSYVNISTGSASGSNNGVEASLYEPSTAPPKVIMFIFDAVRQLWREVHD